MLRAVMKASCIIVYPSRDLYNHLYAHNSSDTKKLKRSLSLKLMKNKRKHVVKEHFEFSLRPTEVQ